MEENQEHGQEGNVEKPGSLVVFGVLGKRDALIFRASGGLSRCYQNGKGRPSDLEELR